MKSRLEYEINTRDIYRDFTECLFDCPELLVRTNLDLLIDLADGRIDGIRQAFKDGMTSMLVPGLMTEIDCRSGRDNIETDPALIEFRVIHDGELIGVIINSEISW